MPEDISERLAWVFRYGAIGRARRFHPGEMAAAEWRDKIDPEVLPDMDAIEVDGRLDLAVDNARIKKLVTLWEALGAVGRVQLHRGKEGRIIRMVGLREIATGWDVPTLICDGTGDATLLRTIWPELKCETEDDWRTLPRPGNVRVTQCVDRAVSMDAVAIYGEGEKLLAREAAARRLYAAVMAKALDYGGADVGVITYKSTREWIEKHCFVPPWLKLAHWGDLTGTNEFRYVCALFVLGRILAPAEANSNYS